MSSPFRTPDFFTPLMSCTEIEIFGFSDVKGVKYNVFGVKVMRPGAEECCAGNAIHGEM